MRSRRIVCATMAALSAAGSAAAAWDMAVVRALDRGRWNQMPRGAEVKDSAAPTGQCSGPTIIFDLSENQIVLSRFDGSGAPTRADFFEDARAEAEKGGLRIELFRSVGDAAPAASYATEGTPGEAAAGAKAPVLDEYGADGAVTARWVPCAKG